VRAKLLSHLLPTPTTTMALVALVFATIVAPVGAKPAIEQPDKDEVTLVTLTGGPVDTTTPGADVEIELNGEPAFTFIQKAGEAVELILTPSTSGNANFCNVTTIIYADDKPLGARVDEFSNKGEVGEGSDIGGLAAPASDTTITLKALTRESGESCDQDVYNDEGTEIIDSGPDTWTVSVRVTIVTLRN
jgi:hypothetical protein